MTKELGIFYIIMSVIGLIGIIWITTHDRKIRKAKQQ